MSRGLGALQRKIISELARQPTKRLLWGDLKGRFAREVELKSFYRAIRGLRRRNLVHDERGGTRHWLELRLLGDDEFFEQYMATLGLLEAVARARGVSIPPIVGLAPPSRELRRASGRQPGVDT